LRFTVHRPASAEVSPCGHRPSAGDVACGVHVGIAPPRAAGDALENRLALAVFRRDVPAVGASLRRVRRRDEFKAPLGLVLEPGHQQTPPLAVDLPVEAPFLRDTAARAFPSPARRAGHRGTFKSSTRTVWKRRATSVVVFSTQSRRRSVSRARNLAMARFVRARRFDPRRARARRRCRRRGRWASPAPRPGTRSSSPHDSATETAAPRCPLTTLPSPGPGTGLGITATAMCHRPARSRLTRSDFAVAGMMRVQRNRTHPTLGTQTCRWRRWVRWEKLRIAWAKSRKACCCTVCDPAASRSYSARDRGQLGTLLVITGGPVASAAAARRPDSTQTGHDDSVRPTLSPAQGWEATETCTQQ
jgi:hypothetical protein